MQDEHGDDMIIDNDEGAAVAVAPSAPPVPNDNVVVEDTTVEGMLFDNDEPVATADDESAQATATQGTEEAGQSTEETTDAGDDTSGTGTSEARPATVEPVTPEPVADPGTEFTPKNDYAFDIELADGTKLHIATPDDVDKIPADADFGTPANLMKAQAKLSAMTSGIEAERREYEANKQKFDSQQEQNAAVAKRVETMVAELNYLEAKGRLPKVDPKYENADWTDPEIQKQAGVKERLDLLNYRAAENAQRTKLGLPEMSLLEAATEMAGQVATAQAEDAKKRDGILRKQKGAMVGGGSAAPQTSLPDDMIIGEGGSLRDLNPAY